MLSELQAIADSLSQRLCRAVAFDDTALRLLVHTAHQGGQVDQVRLDAILQKQTLGPAMQHLLAQGIADAVGPVRVLGRVDLAMLPRICAPVRYADELLGYLWMLDAEGGLSEDDVRATDEAARLAAGVMFRERLLGDLQRGRERETLRDLLGEDETIRRHAAESLKQSDLLLGRGPAVVLVVRIAAERSREELALALDAALLRAVRQMPPASCLWLPRVDHGVVLAARGGGGVDDGQLEALAGSLVTEAQTLLGAEGTVLVGVGDEVTDVGDAASSYWQARRATDVASVLPSMRPIAWWSRLGVYGLLVQLGLGRLPDAALPTALRKLFEVDRSGSLTETLEAYLDHANNPAAAVAVLHIHRTTLYYRLSRITELTGLDLTDGGERLAVHLGLKLARLGGEPERRAR